MFLEVLKLEDQQMMRPAAERGPPISTGPQEEGLLPESQVPPEVSSCKREFFLAAVAIFTRPSQNSSPTPPSDLAADQTANIYIFFKLRFYFQTVHIFNIIFGDESAWLSLWERL